MLYVGKARSIKKRIAAYMAPERQPSRIARMVAQTRSMVFVTTESDAEALLLEANLIKQLKPRYNVTLRDDKSFPYILICTDHPARAARQASRRAQPGWRLFRPVRQRRRGVSHPQCAAARVSPTHLLGQFLRQSDPALPALSDQALLGALHGRDRTRRLCEAGRGGARFPLRPQPGDQGPPWPSNERGRGGARFRKRGAAARPHQRACRRSRASRASIRARFPRPTCSRSPRRRGSSASRCSSSAPTRTGATAPIFRAPTARSPRRKCSTHSWRNSISTGRRRGSCCLSHDVPSAETLGEVLSARAGHRIAIGAPRRGEKKELVDDCAAQCARGAVAQARGGGEPGEAASKRSAGRSASIIRSGGSRSTTIRTSWGPTRSAR